MRRAQSKVICRLLLTHLPYLLDSSWYLQHDTWGHNVRTVGRLWGPCSPLPLSRWCGGHRSHLRNRLPAIAPQRITFTSPSSLLPRPISVVRTSNGCGGGCSVSDFPVSVGSAPHGGGARKKKLGSTKAHHTPGRAGLRDSGCCGLQGGSKGRKSK